MHIVAEDLKTQQFTRRTLYLDVIYALWGIIITALSAPALIYLLWPPKVRRDQEWVEACDVTKLELKAPFEVVFRRDRIDGWKLISEKNTAWIVKLAEN